MSPDPFLLSCFPVHLIFMHPLPNIFCSCCFLFWLVLFGFSQSLLDISARPLPPRTTALVTLTTGSTRVPPSQAIFSNWGACVQIYAPGNGIKSASHADNSSYVYMSGTSMSAPFVTGAAALFLQVLELRAAAALAF